MGTSAAETVEEIEDLRARIDVELRELEARVPPPSVWMRRGALAGVVAVSLTTMTAWGARSVQRRIASAAAERRIRRAMRHRSLLERAGDATRSSEWRAAAVGTLALAALVDLAGFLELRRLRSEVSSGRDVSGVT